MTHSVSFFYEVHYISQQKWDTLLQNDGIFLFFIISVEQKTRNWWENHNCPFIAIIKCLLYHISFFTLAAMHMKTKGKMLLLYKYRLVIGMLLVVCKNGMYYVCQYLCWNSWCHLLKSMWNTTTEPVDNPAIKNLQKKIIKKWSKMGFKIDILLIMR